MATGGHAWRLWGLNSFSGRSCMFEHGGSCGCCWCHCCFILSQHASNNSSICHLLLRWDISKRRWVLSGSILQTMEQIKVCSYLLLTTWSPAVRINSSGTDLRRLLIVVIATPRTKRQTLKTAAIQTDRSGSCIDPDHCPLLFMCKVFTVPAGVH